MWCNRCGAQNRKDLFVTDITRETYADVNARAIDSWNAQGWEWGTPP